jgi:hypothetical protein
MAKKKRKKKNRHESEVADVPIVAQESAGISATALATFARDLSTFGARAKKPPTEQVR